MIRRKVLRKIFVTTLCLFIVLIVYTIKNNIDDNTVRVNLEIEDVTGITNASIYLLNDDDYLVKKKIFINKNNNIDDVKKVFYYLKDNNKKHSNKLKGIIPVDCEIKELYLDEDYLTINFNSSFLKCDNLDTSVSGLVHSMMDSFNLKGVLLLVEDNYINGYNYYLDNSLDINKEVSITSKDNITKVVLYYLNVIDDEVLYIPVTKYLNDSREKIDIIVSELSSNTSIDLVSYVNSNLELVNSREENDAFILNFNNYLFDSSDKVLEEVLYCISYSVFDNYDVDAIMVEVDGHNIDTIYRKSIKNS